jgi:hypothetical protein
VNSPRMSVSLKVESGSADNRTSVVQIVADYCSEWAISARQRIK